MTEERRRRTTGVVGETAVTFAVKSARDLGLQFTDNPHRMVGQDGAYSIPLGQGEALWFFGDTLIGARTPGESLWFPGGRRLGPGDMSGHGLIERLLTNSACIVNARTGRGGLRPYQYILDGRGSLHQLVPRLAGEHPDEVRVWCFHGLAQGEAVWLFYQTVRMLADGPMPVNFEIIGSGLAAGRRGDWTFRRLAAPGAGGPDGTIWWPANQPQFGAAVLPSAGDGFLYVFGVLKDAGGVQRCHVARVPSDRIEDRAAYEYLAEPAPERQGAAHEGSGTKGGPAWTGDPRRSVPIMSGMPNELSVSWNPRLGRYLAVHSLDLTGRIVGRTAPHPWGPWSEPVVLWTVVPPRLDYEVPYPPLIYAGKEHPELAEEDGRVIYVTYVEFEEYFPHLVEVELE
ncbi:MAG: hypothetical protein Kow0059_11410 [Candidatus Sumerlaeia bacterium]